MGKTIPMTAKFTEEEADRIDSWAASKGLSRSAALHDLIMKSFEHHINENPGNTDSVRFLFTDDYTYFWKGREYPGFIRDGEAHIKFGGDWKIYKLEEIPVEVFWEV